MSLNMGYQGQMSRSLWPEEGLSFYIVLPSSNNVRTWPDFSYSFILFTKFKLQKVPKVMVTDLLYDFHVYCLKSEEICFICIFWHTYYRLIAIISHIMAVYFIELKPISKYSIQYSFWQIFRYRNRLTYFPLLNISVQGVTRVEWDLAVEILSICPVYCFS